jgi:hypothetical protein
MAPHSPRNSTPRFPSSATARVAPAGRVRELIRQVHFHLATGKSDLH